ncbi:MAG: hypothetical protein Kow0029_04210 [Candidatus Rifleibacteriota bacterium]
MIYVNNLKNLYRKQVDPAEPIAGKQTALEILLERFKGTISARQIAIALPANMQNEGLHNYSKAKELDFFFYDQNKIVEKPVSLQQQRWDLEDDSGCDTWIGAAFFEPCEKMKWSEFVLLPLENLLVEPSAVIESIRLYHQEGFEICFSDERQTGANWAILKADVVKAMMRNHEDLMWARGGFAWALKMPLYPFNSGIFHNPRVRPRLNCDLRFNSRRSKRMYEQLLNEDFVSPEFSYENWLKCSGWESLYVAGLPRIFHIEPSAVCRAKCFGCPQGSLKRKKGLMPISTFRLLIEGISDVSEHRFIFSGMGEPLLNPALSDMLDYVHNASAMLVTSMQRLPEPGFNFSSLDQLRLSVDALEAESFANNRTGCSWKNIESFISKASEIKAAAPDKFPEMGVSFVRHGKNEEKALAFINYWKKVTNPVFKDHFFRWPFDFRPDKMQWFQILGENGYLNLIDKSSKIDFTPVKRRPCRHALLSATILWDGRVAMCPFDVEAKVVIGDLTRNNISEIWNSEGAIRLRNAHLAMNNEALPDICKNCKDWYHNI